MRRLAVLLAALASGAHAAPGGRVVVDLRDMDGWQVGASEQVGAVLGRGSDGSACLEYDFHSVSGYAVLTHRLPVEWPPAFALQLRVKGSGPDNDFQVKVSDASGENVWWVNRPGFPLPRSPTDVTFRSRHFAFAWGPTADRTLRRTETLELVIAAGQGGRGTLCVSRVLVQEREPDPAVWPEPSVQRGPGTLEIDYRRMREFSGITLQWPGPARPESYDVLASDDGRAWRLLRRVERSSGGFEALFFPESEARFLGIRSAAQRAPPEVQLRDARQWPDLNAALSELARHAPRGHVPRAFLGEQNYWTLVGVDGGGERSALLSEDGALEVGRGGYSVEPAVLVDGGELATWADVRIGHALWEGYLPLPDVRWRHGAFDLRVSAAADGDARAPQVLARYALTNTGAAPRTFTLLLAVRPWQVNPPQQLINTPGGARRIDGLRWQAPELSVNGAAGPRLPEAPSRVSALPGAGGIDLEALRDAPALQELSDAQGQASAMLQFGFRLSPGETRVVTWTAPLGGAPAPPSPQTVDERMDRVAAGWRARLNRMELTVPASSQAVADTLRTALADILMSRDGAALRPATRSYARTWIRDGAMMVAGLVRMGELDVARDFVDWFAEYVFQSGRVPCCVDVRGADPVPENDSDGEFLFAVAEVWRHSGDAAFLRRHWAVVQRVVAHLEGLRETTRTEEFRATHPAHLHGLLPPSISHEGYSDRPAYSYWDDFWAVRGYKDAVEIAQAVGQPQRAAEWGRWRDEFQDDLARSVEATAAHHGMDVIAGAADRGDFDPTSTTVALNPAQARVSPALLQRTFARYWEESQQRRAGARGWTDYAPYELRTVGALVRLGEPRRAHEMLDWFLPYRRPARWNQWAEVVMADAREPHFLGDMPHAWIASDYIRSVLDMFAFEREADDALVLGAGLGQEWMSAGVSVKNLSTRHGPVTFRLSSAAGGHLLELGGGIVAPRGGVRFAWPVPGRLPRASCQGAELRWVGRELLLPPGPATVHLNDG
ncbi:MAG TPA: discoidin domain-containing protein [Anaeromyxobacteraceae bacterium]|nr:discoidin domain-containing protein [Anaeromyxobacteraceae bacterium]